MLTPDASRPRRAAHDVATVLISGAPGSGKTELLVRTMSDLGTQLPIGVITCSRSNQRTDRDAERIRATGVPVAQAITGPAGRLDTGSLAAAIDDLGPDDGGLVLVEDVGGFAGASTAAVPCTSRVVVTAVTEDVDTPLKFPYLFAAADLVVINKVDLLADVDFDIERFRANVLALRPGATVIATSAARGTGLCEWYRWLLRPAYLHAAGTASGKRDFAQ